MKNDFEKIITAGGLTVGYISGSDKVLFIKTGQGGSIYGDDNRYLRLAEEINGKYGFSVFASATVNDTRESFSADVEVVENILGTPCFEMYYLGISKGGLIGIWHGCCEQRIRKMVSINAPLMINYYGKTLPAIKRLGEARLTMVYGALDPSFKYIPFAQRHARIEIIDGADHNLIGSEYGLMQIVERYMQP